RVSTGPSKWLTRMRLCRPEQDVTLLAERQFDHAFGCEIGRPQNHSLVGQRDVIDAKAAALDLAPCLAVGADEPGLDEGCQDAETGLKLGLRNFNRRQVLRDGAFLEGLPRRLRRLPCGFGAVKQRGR